MVFFWVNCSLLGVAVDKLEDNNIPVVEGKSVDADDGCRPVRVNTWTVIDRRNIPETRAPETMDRAQRCEMKDFSS